MSKNQNDPIKKLKAQLWNLLSGQGNQKKVKEIVSAKQPFYRTKTVSSGIVIANGRYIKKPYKIVLKDYLVTINENPHSPDMELVHTNQVGIQVFKIRK